MFEDGRETGLQLRRMIAALFGLTDPLDQPGEAVGGSVEIEVKEPAAWPPQHQEQDDNG